MLFRSPLTPTALEIAVPEPRVLIRFETTPDAAARQAAAAAELCRAAGADVRIIDGDLERRTWQEVESRVWAPAHTVVRLALLPTHVADTLDAVAAAAARHQVAWCAAGRAGLGVLFAGLDGEPAAVARVLADVRAHVSALAGGASAVVMASPTWGPADTWGDIGAALPVMRAVKDRFDPRGTLCPGRFPWGA